MTIHPVYSGAPLDAEEKQLFEGFSIDVKPPVPAWIEYKKIRLTRMVNSWPEEFRDYLKNRKIKFYIYNEKGAAVYNDPPQFYFPAHTLADIGNERTAILAVQNKAMLYAVEFAIGQKSTDWKALKAEMIDYHTQHADREYLSGQLEQVKGVFSSGNLHAAIVTLFSLGATFHITDRNSSRDKLSQLHMARREAGVEAARKCAPFLFKEAGNMDPVALEKQKAFFAKLDEMVCYLGLEKDEFDRHLRQIMVSLILDTAGIANPNIVREESADAVSAAAIAGEQAVIYARIQTIAGHLFRTYAPGLPGITNVYNRPDTNLHYEKRTQEAFEKMQAALGNSVSFDYFDPARPLLADFRKGKRGIFDLDNSTPVLEIDGINDLPSLQKMLGLAIHTTLSRHSKVALKSHESEHFGQMLTELDTAYAEAAITPAEWKALRDSKQRELDLAQHRRDQALASQKQVDNALELARKEAEAFKVIPFIFSGTAQSLASRAGSSARIRDVVDRELIPVRNNLNVNFAPHSALINPLFRDGNQHIMRNISYITADGKTPGVNEPVTRAAQEQVRNILTMQLDTSPVHEANRTRHEQLVQALYASPVMLVSALGIPSMVEEVRTIQHALFPDRGKSPQAEARDLLIRRRNGLAVRALEMANIPVPEALREAATIAAPPPPAPPAPQEPPALPPPPPTPPPASEPPKPTVEDPDAPPPTPPKNDPTPPPAPVPIVGWDEALAHAETFVAKQLNEAPPFHMLRCSLGMQPGHSITLHMSRWVEEAGVRRAETKSTTMEIHQPKLDDALELKKRLQTHLLSKEEVIPYRRLQKKHGLQKLGEDEILPLSAPIVDPILPAEDGKAGRIIKRGGVYVLHLEFADGEIRTEADLSLGVAQNGSIEEANLRRELVLERLQRLQNGKSQTTPQDLRTWLQHSALLEADWQSATSIKLSQHTQIQTKITLGFPNKGTGQIATLHIGNPRRLGTPNEYWSIPLEIRVDGKLIAKPSINTHVSDADMAVRRITEATQHIQTVLTEYAEQNPKAHWQLREDNELNQLDPVHLEESANMDWTRWNRMISELNYVSQLDVHVSPLQTDETGQTYFTLAVKRADKSPFMEEGERGGAVAIERRYTIPAGTKPAEATQIAEQFRKSVHDRFKHLLDAAYNPADGTTTIGDATKVIKPVDPYNARSIAKKFDAAWRATLPEAKTSGAAIDVAPIDPAQSRHTPLQELLGGRGGRNTPSDRRM